jgi:RimJ/RimL family protein N-acetyltransferase
VTGQRGLVASLDTERLTLRPFTRAEAEHVLAGDRTGRRWTAGYPRDDDKDVARMYFDAHGDVAPDDTWFGPLQIVRKDTGAVIGGIGFFGPPDATGTVTVGYGVAPEVEGYGYTTEALRALVGQARRSGRVRRIVADTAPGNRASERVLEKVGLQLVGSDDELRHHALDITGA